MWPFRTAKKPAGSEFRGTPAVRRVKHYASASGHTYRYSYSGWQPNGPGSVEHHFECRRDNAPAVTVRVRLLQANADACSQAIGRHLLDSERYAIVKLALFRIMDDTPEVLPSEPIVPTALEMVESLRQLNRL